MKVEIRSVFRAPASWPFDQRSWGLYLRNQVLSRRLGRSLRRI